MSEPEVHEGHHCQLKQIGILISKLNDNGLINVVVIVITQN